MISGKAKSIHSVFAIFKLIDDFTGKAISDSIISFFINDLRVLPIRKSDGIYVLTNLNINNVKISIESANYCTYIIDNFQKPKDGGIANIIPIRLHSGLNYPIKPGITAFSAAFVKSNGEPSINTNIQLFAPFSNDSVKLKAIKTLNGIKAAIITNPKGLDFTGLTLTAPAVKPSTTPIIINIISKIDNMTFEIAEMPENKAAIEEAILKRVYSSYTDKNGQVLIPLEIQRNSENSEKTEEFAIELYISPSEPILKSKQAKGSISKEIFIKPGNLTQFKDKFIIV